MDSVHSRTKMTVYRSRRRGHRRSSEPAPCYIAASLTALMPHLHRWDRRAAVRLRPVDPGHPDSSTTRAGAQPDDLPNNGFRSRGARRPAGWRRSRPPRFDTVTSRREARGRRCSESEICPPPLELPGPTQRRTPSCSGLSGVSNATSRIVRRLSLNPWMNWLVIGCRNEESAL
jgi:hypothetical protein